jgi:hypothetical protein
MYFVWWWEYFVCCLVLCYIYEGESISYKSSISKLQIVIEKKRLGIMTYKQYLFFKAIFIRRWWPSCLLGWCLWRAATLPAWRSPPADDSIFVFLSALPRASAPNCGLRDLTGNAHRTWATFLCGYPLLPYFCPQKPYIATLFYRGTRFQGRNSCSVFAVMRIQIVACHNKTR